MAERGVLVPKDIQAWLEPKLQPDLTRAQRLLEGQSSLKQNLSVQKNSSWRRPIKQHASDSHFKEDEPAMYIRGRYNPGLDTSIRLKEEAKAAPDAAKTTFEKADKIAQQGIQLPEEVQAGLRDARHMTTDSDTGYQSAAAAATSSRSRWPPSPLWSRGQPRSRSVKRRSGAMSARESLTSWRQKGRTWAELPESIQRGLGVPQLRPNLTPAQKLHLTELEGEWAAAKLEREEVHKKCKAAKEAVEKAQKDLEEAEKAWRSADNTIKKVSAERRLFFENHSIA
ncbi:uncharacterized protein NFIA_026810 [Aspergillus fischeri NRRL 181]|uniref:Uncharacterized protein n=1 Tax=Neosartorya fischeri (strain ATCC 1020 / DSM 3700 / CBS 544.65 / FGSC A1164 / JCM 1740 / NRRL 181 / WB 181) TaxID=331117 RepID=A1DCP7_NEOFI|nr:uncharacterized protein NFIA_026810 [Aspergillus fischeri NRRL 181]EAW19607.1 hypothetical protein NFIA_026810 [Aspergillus fischeri NRRL 181]